MQRLVLPEVIPSDVEVFRLNLDPDTDVPVEDRQVLSREEVVRAGRFHRLADRVRFTRTRVALRRLIGDRLGIAASEVRFDVNHRGKPRIHCACSATPPLRFNVSHSGAHALIAVSPRRSVGLDIERRDPERDQAELWPLILSPREQAASVQERLEFFDCWSAKEAVLKALGVGVGDYLQRLSVLRSRVDDAVGDGRSRRAGPGSRASGRKGPGCVVTGRDEPGGEAAGIEAHVEFRLHCEGVVWPEVKACRLPAPVGYAAALAWFDTALSPPIPHVPSFSPGSHPAPASRRLL